MLNMSTWLQANHWDPAESEYQKISFNSRSDYVDLNCTIFKYLVKGHSKEIQFNNITFEDDRFVVDFDMAGNITYYGMNYTVNGTVNSVNPIWTTGAWNITVPSVNLYEQETRFSNHDDDEYVEAGVGNNFGVRVNQTGYKMYFENLLDHPSAVGYELYINRVLIIGFTWQISQGKNAPQYDILRKVYSRYITAVFANVTVEEFTGATLPPSTTAEIVTSTTTNPSGSPSSGMDQISHSTSCSLYYLCIIIINTFYYIQKTI